VDILKKTTDARSNNYVRRSTKGYINNEPFRGDRVAEIEYHISTGTDTQIDLETLYVMIIVLAIVGLLSILRRAKDCMLGRTATTTMKTRFVHEGSCVMSTGQEQLSLQRQASRSTST
jgi:hypothetical protein